MSNDYDKMSSIISSAIKMNVFDKTQFRSNSKQKDFNSYIKRFNDMLDRWRSYYSIATTELKKLNKLFVRSSKTNRISMKKLDDKFKLLKIAKAELSTLETIKSQKDQIFSRVVNNAVSDIEKALIQALTQQNQFISEITTMLQNVATVLCPEPLSIKDPLTKVINSFLDREFKKVRAGLNNKKLLKIGKNELLISSNEDQLVFGRYIPIHGMPKLDKSIIDTVYLVYLISLDKNKKYGNKSLTFSLNKTSPSKLLLSSMCCVVKNPTQVKKSIFKLTSNLGYLVFYENEKTSKIISNNIYNIVTKK